MSSPKRLLITPGEPAGIGPDICIQMAALPNPSELIVIADSDVLKNRAKELKLPLTLIECDLHEKPSAHLPYCLKILPIKTAEPVKAGILNPKNANYVLKTLEKAATLCESKKADALVTGPVHKGVINEAGFAFSGHTEFLGAHALVEQTVMLFVVGQLKVALASTHLPLSEVPKALNKAHLRKILKVLLKGLKEQFHLLNPRILVAGLNPHAGENGHLGKEEIEIITPLLNEFRKEGNSILGPFPADTLFTPPYLKEADAILAMYHDQALPLVKYLGFGQAVNVTLGLPYLRTSVDHGTALDIAGSGKADASSLNAALSLAQTLLSL